MRNLGRLAEHDRGRAVFFGRQVHGLFDALGVERLAGDGEVDVDPVKTLGSVSARVASMSATQSVTCWRPFLRMWTTSKAEQPPNPQQQYFNWAQRC
jgi:hypothetical protein